VGDGKSKTRQHAKAETREALIRAGMSAFSEQGVDLPSLDAICARAGFTRGAFYVHFKDRDDFLEAVVDRVVTDFVTSVVAADDSGDDLGTTIGRFLEAAVAGRVPLLGHQQRFMQLMAQGMQRAGPMRERFRVILQGVHESLQAAAERGPRTGRVRTALPPKEIATLLLAAALGLAQLLEAEVELDYAGLERSVFELLQISRE
jgi:AcrR family transcriptional regulator